MRVAGQKLRQSQRQQPQAQGKLRGVGGAAAGRRHDQVWRRAGMACLHELPCRRFAVAQKREHENTDRPWGMGRAIGELGEGEKQRDNALQYPPVHPDCRASVQFAAP